MTDLSGTILDGKYELICLIGEGGMGAVYEAKHKLIGRHLAVKFLHSQYVTSEEVVTRFQREAQAAAAIGHDNIIEVTDMGKDAEGAPFLVMEYLEGQDVRELLAEIGVIPVDRTAHIMIQSLSALHAAHEAGIIHRDLKPENIYLIEKSDRPDYVKLLDFGISKFRSLEAEGMKALTQTGTVLGTPYYMSPEQARGDQDIGPRSDIYSMGVILFQMLTGTLPFDAPNYNALLIKILTEDPPDPLEINPELPLDLVQIIKIAMAREPENRFETCLAFRERLKRYGPGASGAYQTTMSAASQSAVRAAALADKTLTPLEMTKSGGVAAPKNRLPLVAGIGVLALVASVVLGMVFFNNSEPEPVNEVVPLTPPGSLNTAAEAPKDEKIEEAPPVKNVSVRITAKPDSAQIRIDGQLKPSNPFEMSVPPDETSHKIEIQAEGYQSVSSDTQFDRDKALTFTLSRKVEEKSTRKSSHRRRRAEKAKVEKKTPKPKPKPEPAAETPKPKPKRRTKREIDEGDPW